MKFLVIPDSFKGSITSTEFCEIFDKTVKNLLPDAEITSSPIADGGEGTVECITKLLNGKLLTTKVTDGNFIKNEGSYGFVNQTAYIAVANSSGLPKTMIKDPAFTTTYGMGEHILQAKNIGKKDFVLCLGGSSTNDCGAGLLCALGAKFFDETGKEFVPTGGSLTNIKSYDLSGLNETIQDLRFTALCDVKNPLLGKNGCSYVFAPQKGARTPEAVQNLEKNMQYFYKIMPKNVPESTQGAGAAGGLGYCVLNFLHGKLVSGIDYILDQIDFDFHAQNTNYIVTGEGAFDKTSLNGKVIGGIIQRANPFGKKVTVFCGINRNSESSLPNVNRVYEISDRNIPFEEQLKMTPERLRLFITQFLKDEEIC